MPSSVQQPYTPSSLPTPPPLRGAVRSAILAGMDASVTGLVAGLEAEGVHTWSAGTPEELVRMADEMDPELVLLGAELKFDLRAVLEDIRAAAPRARAFFLLTEPSPNAALDLVRAGVDDVLIPPFTAAGVLMRVHVGSLLLRRNTGVGTAGNPHIMVDRFSRSVEDSSGTTTLTAREFELLERLVLAGGRVVPREDLLSDIWGAAQDSEAVLDATVHRLRRKLERDHSAPQLLVTIRGVGYRLEASRVRISEN
jgi:two-component system, OmpR family, response regulator RegX3